MANLYFGILIRQLPTNTLDQMSTEILAYLHIYSVHKTQAGSFKN